MRLSYIGLFGLLVWGIGCSEGGGENIMVGFSGGEQSLNVKNYSSRTIYYFAVDQSELALIDWIPTTNPSAPDRIESGALKKISFDEIYLFDAGGYYCFFLLDA
ncbi:MAG: hypothetical protein HY088_07975 [Ignavibacteriales bacterium]|nr:hypothetical protein [Ignavibacteriales bacterium]